MMLLPTQPVVPQGAQEVNPLPPTGDRTIPLRQTSLDLTLEQEAKLVERCLLRIDELKSEMGLDTAGQCMPAGWMEKRQLNQAQYDNDWRHRVVAGTIYQYSNFSLNLSKRYTRLMAAKVADDLVGTDPFFASMPQKHGDPELAKQAEWYVQEKISASNAKASLIEGTKSALIRNEVVMKETYAVQATRFEGPGTVAVGPFRYDGPTGPVETAAGEPIITPKGQYIYQKDDVLPDPNVEKMFRLKKEPTVVFRHALEFKYFGRLSQTLVSYEGLDSRQLDYRDFLCPLTVNSVHEADINVHLFDEQFERLRFTYGDFEVSQNYVTQPYLSGERAPKEKQGETEAAASQILKTVNCADCYIRCNPFEGADNDLGDECEVWVLIDIVAKKAIWYDYLGNHMKKRPFEVIVGIEKVPNRWYGCGVFEMLDHKQSYIDTQFNRINFKSSKSSSVRFRVKNAVAQWKAGQKLVVGDDQVYDVEDPRYDAKNPPLYQVNLTDIDEWAVKLIELMIQAGSNEVGIVGPDDAQIAGLDSTKLATGIKSLERTGNVLMKRTEQDQGEGIAAVLDQMTDIILEHMDDNEIIYYPDSQALVQLNREEIRGLKSNVKLLLTRSRSTETIELGRMVVQLCREYYEALNPYEQYKLRDEYVRQLKALEVQDADGLLDEVSKEQADQFLKEQAEKKPDLPPKTSVASKITLYPSERAQIVAREGITPASQAEMDQVDTQEAQKEVAKQSAIAQAKESAKPPKEAPAPEGEKPPPPPPLTDLLPSERGQVLRKDHGIQPGTEAERQKIRHEVVADEKAKHPPKPAVPAKK